MDRPMIVGATDHDYDNLMASVGAEPPHEEYAVGAPLPPPHYYQQQQHHPRHPPQQVQYVQQVPHYGPAPQRYAPAPQQMIVAAPPQQVLVAAPQQQQQRHVINEPMTKARDWPIGFMSNGPIPANSPPVEIEVKPQSLFKGRRLSVAASIAKDFVIVDIKVGTNPQQGATGEMPAESFASTAIDTRMQFDTAAPGTTITIRVRNVSNTPSVFMATLFGDVLA